MHRIIQHNPEGLLLDLLFRDRFRVFLYLCGDKPPKFSYPQNYPETNQIPKVQHRKIRHQFFSQPTTVWNRRIGVRTTNQHLSWKPKGSVARNNERNAQADDKAEVEAGKAGVCHHVSAHLHRVRGHVVADAGGQRGKGFKSWDRGALHSPRLHHP